MYDIINLETIVLFSGVCFLTYKLVNNKYNYLFNLYSTINAIRYSIENKTKKTEKYKDWDISHIILKNKNTNFPIIIDNNLVKNKLINKSIIKSILEVDNLPNSNNIEDIFIEIHYYHNDNIYILPIFYEMIDDFKYTPYENDEILFKNSYKKIETNKYNNSMDLFYNIIIKYGGPLGDFYKDTQYKIFTNHIYFDDHNPVLHNDQDYLFFENDIGETFRFNHGEHIQIKSIFD